MSIIDLNPESETYLSFDWVVDGRVESVLSDSEGLAGDADPAAVQRLHRDLETHAGFTQQVSLYKTSTVFLSPEEPYRHFH